MDLTMLGTGHAGVLNCYNTCFVLEEKGDYLLVDTGGGNGLMKRLRQAGISAADIRHIFITHRHLDHITGLLWMLRLNLSAMRKGRILKPLTIYGHNEVIRAARHFVEDLFPDESYLLNDTVILKEVHDRETLTILHHPVTFFDIQSKKARQFGFSMETEKGHLVCLGDEPLSSSGEPYAKGARLLLHEAFCMYADADKYKPYEKSHSTVKDACENAERLGVKNLLLYHTEESDLEHRKENYTREGSAYFHGNLLVPDDLEKITVFN